MSSKRLDLDRRSLLKLAGAGAAAGALATGGTLAAGRPAAAHANEVTTSFTIGDPTGATITPTDFAYNTPFYFTGLYHGTLPAGDPATKRAEFAAALKETGVRALRFPGGTPALLYLPQGEQYTEKLVRGLVAENPEYTAGKLYQPDKWSHNHYVTIENFLDFCREYGFEPIYQLNTAFYYDPDDRKAWGITPTRWTVRKDGSVVTQYYDRPRIAEAAAVLRTHIDDLRSKGFDIRYWEIGNEEFAQYDTGRDFLNPGNDDHEIERYADVVAAFAGVIREKTTEATVMIAGTRNWRGQPWNVPLLTALEANGGLSLIDQTTLHYPFSHENKPDSPDQPLTDFVTTDMGMAKNLAVTRADLEANGFGDVGIAVTETSAYRLPHWKGLDVTATLAHGLVWAHNFAQAAFEADTGILVKHDLESTFFGGLMYDVVLDPALTPKGKRNLHWIGPDGQYNKPLDTDPSEIPDDNWYRDRYFIAPQMRANALLSSTSGNDVLSVTPSSFGELVSLFASRKELGSSNFLTLLAVNRTPTAQTVKTAVATAGLHCAGRFAQLHTLAAAGEWGLEGILPGEYAETTGRVPVERGSDGAVSVTMNLPAYSLTQVRFHLVSR